MITIPKGTKDVLPKDSYKWHRVYDIIAVLRDQYHLKEIMTPTFEHTELFERGVGDGSDIVRKEMYTFLDKGNRSLTLKPEGTAGVARSFIENNLDNDILPIKMYYVTPCFRYERPQAGRLREHHQFGVEIYGSDSVLADVEAISIAYQFYVRMGIQPTVELNTLGCEHCRANYIDALKKYYAQHLDAMCPDCQDRFKKNPLRILDCKVPSCKEITKNAPVVRDYVCEDCKTKFDTILKLLDTMHIPYKINDRLVRGIDYYTNLVFEFIDEDKKLGQNALGAGGRYNNLIAELGGKSVPVVGFGIGIERILLYLENKGIALPEDKTVDYFVVSVIDDMQYTLQVVQKLRNQGYNVDFDLLSRSLKAQFKYANKIGSKYVIVIGQDEYESGVLTVKNMENHEEKKMTLEEIVRK